MASALVVNPLVTPLLTRKIGVAMVDAELIVVVAVAVRVAGVTLHDIGCRYGLRDLFGEGCRRERRRARVAVNAAPLFPAPVLPYAYPRLHPRDPVSKAAPASALPYLPHI